MYYTTFKRYTRKATFVFGLPRMLIYSEAIGDINYRVRRAHALGSEFHPDAGMIPL